MVRFGLGSADLYGNVPRIVPVAFLCIRRTVSSLFEGFY